MRKFPLTTRLFAVTVLTCANANEVSAPNLIEFGYGATAVDFTHDGVPDLVVLGHRDNFNAHSSDVASFYVLSNGKSKKQWNIVPVIKNGKEQFEVMVNGGADCILHDFRLLSGPDKDSTSLIIADRDLGVSFNDSQTVTFTHYSLLRNVEGIPGIPLYSFEALSVSKTKIKYCDVGEAFKKELGFDHSKYRWQGNTWLHEKYSDKSRSEASHHVYRE